MLVKLFGDCTPINWEQLGIRMPFAPMHELAKKYELELLPLLEFLPVNGYFQPGPIKTEDILRTFEIQSITDKQACNLVSRIDGRICNTIAALDQATPDTICINLGGGYTHAGKYPNTGYAYSLINDICWAVDYQLEQGKTIGIIDLDFHFGGGTAEYYEDNLQVHLSDYYHPKGVLMKHTQLIKQFHQDWIMSSSLHDILIPDNCDTILLNLGTDWFHDDPIFGKYGNMLSHDILLAWMETIQQIVDRKIPLCITMGGGYGEDGLSLYEHLIEWIRFYQSGTSVVL